MRKRNLVLIFSIIVILSYFIINFKYFSSVTKVVYYKELDTENIISRYVDEFFDMIKEEKYEEAYLKLYDSKLSSKEQLKEYFIGRIMVNESLIEAFEVDKISKDEYKVKVHIYPPLYTTYEQLEKEEYKDKDIYINLKLDGIFNYYIMIN